MYISLVNIPRFDAQLDLNAVEDAHCLQTPVCLKKQDLWYFFNQLNSENQMSAEF